MIQQQQIRAKCQEVFAKAQQLYNLDLSRVLIRFDLRGRAAGVAYRRASQYGIRFNHDMLTRDAFDHVLNDTVPHEVAHIVCFMNPALGHGHNGGWARVCRALGGTGATRHSEEVVYGKGTTYEYTTTNGHKVRVSDQMHKKMHVGGVTYTYRQGKGKIDRHCEHVIVGMGGRTLAQPIVRPAVPRPAVQAAPVTSGLDDLQERLRRFMGQPVYTNTVGAADRSVLPPVAEPAVQAAVEPVNAPAAPVFNRGESKASIARAIMLSGHRQGQSYEDIIAAIMRATGHDRQLARATFKANAAKVGIPANFC